VGHFDRKFLVDRDVAGNPSIPLDRGWCSYNFAGDKNKK